MWRIIIIIMLLTNTAFAQHEGQVNWLSFQQLNDSLKVKPKKVFIDFYADWCAPCLKMQREVFTDEHIVKILNGDYYAVKMNVESTDTISFGNQQFVNKRVKRRNPVHQIPELMASQKDKPFSLPALVFLDEDFRVQSRYFQFLDVGQLKEILLN